MWTVQSGYLVAMKMGTKLYEGRPHIDQYKQTDVGSYKNLSCPFYWLIARIKSKKVHKTLTAMVTYCGWKQLMPDSGSQEQCIHLYLEFPAFAMHKHSKWVSFEVEVLEYKLGKDAHQFAVCCNCREHFTPRVEKDEDRLVSPFQLKCACCNK